MGARRSTRSRLSLVCPLAVVDIREKADADPDAQVTPDDLSAWIATNGPIPQGACVAQNAAGRSGWAQPVSAMPMMLGKCTSRVSCGSRSDAFGRRRRRGSRRRYLSIDYGLSADFATHYRWLPANRWAVENMANLDEIPATGATLIVGAPKHQGGTGGPCRLIALV